ncbi:SEM4B protein, partial [Polyodon spathula]|nr:SEM4B protein [Polyodon spathula]
MTHRQGTESLIPHFQKHTTPKAGIQIGSKIRKLQGPPRLPWPAVEKKIKECGLKGKSHETQCFNFIRVLLPLNETHLYTCGTYAFSPTCAYINIEEFSLTPDSQGKPLAEDGKSRCPFDPYQKHTAIMVEGELYAGTVSNFQGNTPVISRSLGRPMKMDNTLGWLQGNSTFIKGSAGQDKVYFFFSEVSKEYEFTEKLTVSRIAQVCTSDVGGERVLQGSWTTFVKALLKCSSPGEVPYNIIQDAFTLPPPEGSPVEDTLFYVTFNAQWAGGAGRSAVCVFSLADVKAVFAGNYKKLHRGTQRWVPHIMGNTDTKPGNAMDKDLAFVKDTFLADGSVTPKGRGPVLVSPELRYSKIAAQRVAGARKQNYIVLFLLTESGSLHKVVLLEGRAPHIIEEIELFTEVLALENLLLSVEKGVVFVGSSEAVFEIPVSNCSFYQSCGQCVLARDPFCGWDPGSKSCTETGLSQSQLIQDIERGNADKFCSSQSMTPKSGSHSRNTPAIDVNIAVTLKGTQSLPCPLDSRLAVRIWTRNGQNVSQHDYMQKEDGTLSFLINNTTLGLYQCTSVEANFRQVVARYRLEEQTSPAPYGSHTHTEPQPPVVKETTFQKISPPLEPVLPPRNEKNYYKELVAVCCFLALILLSLLLGALYVCRQRLHGKARVQVCSTVPQKAANAGSFQEQIPLSLEKQNQDKIENGGTEKKEAQKNRLSNSNGDSYNSPA